ncbi:MAG: sugar transferase [Flavobacteriales bacterium]|nr:sugar transferase [Flavobacteriales bacterium]
MGKRIFDIAFSLVALVLLSPLFFVLAIIVLCDGSGGIFFTQVRVGKNGKTFRLIKFRTMRSKSEASGQLTIGSGDHRITRSGSILRNYKLDELPQLVNVLLGQMSIVGPRPEVPRYVALYNEEQQHVLDISPGITDYASLQYFHESDLLAKSENPEETYINEVMPAKLQLNLQYIREQSFISDCKIIGRTVRKIFA